MALKDFRPMMERCSNCLNCKWIPFDKVQSMRFGENCPSVCYNNFNAYSARGRFQLSQALLDERAEYTEAVTDVIHSCLACGACDVSCKICRYNLEPLAHNLELKHSAVEKGKTLPVQDDMIKSLHEEKTLLTGMKKEHRLDWKSDIKVKNAVKEQAEVIFFPGCKYSYDDKLKGYALDCLEILV
ncbi:MAG: hypothetical protein ACI4LD_04235, partial [Lentihominibacter sp.]